MRYESSAVAVCALVIACAGIFGIARASDSLAVVDAALDSLSEVRRDVRAGMDLVAQRDSLLAVAIDSLRVARVVLLAESDSVPAVAAVVKDIATLRTGPSGQPIAAAPLRPGESVVALAWTEGCFLVRRGGDAGYVNGLALVESKDLTDLRAVGVLRDGEAKAKLDAERSRKHEAKQKVERQASAANREQRREALIAKWGAGIGSRILRGELWIGMTPDMVRDSRGSPHQINRTVTRNGVHEQWVYDALYVYIENDLLTAWQDTAP